MRPLLLLIGILYTGIILSQPPGPNELYKKIVNHYQQNPNRLEIVRHLHKNIFRYDTTISHFGYLALNQDEFFIFAIDSTFSVTSGLLSSNENYLLKANSPEKIRIQNNELKGTIYLRLKEIPARQASTFFKLINRFSFATSVTVKNNSYSAKTRQGYLEVDTSTFRITKVSQSIPYKKNYRQYDEFYYLQLSDSIEQTIKKQIRVLTDAAKDFPVITIKELENQNHQIEKLEGKVFAFKNLVSINQGSLDAIMKDKYVIFDFFYLSCLPCHKMTGYILEWLSETDISNVIIVGVNPADSEYNMKMEIENKKINYPVIIGKQAKEIARLYVQRGYPNLLLVSPEGIILHHHIGMSKNFLTKAEKIISQ